MANPVANIERPFELGPESGRQQGAECFGWLSLDDGAFPRPQYGFDAVRLGGQESVVADDFIAGSFFDPSPDQQQRPYGAAHLVECHIQRILILAGEFMAGRARTTGAQRPSPLRAR